MGDRSAIVIRVAEDKAIEIYSHWNGKGIVYKLPEALEVAKDRYNDVAYFTRIVIQNVLNSIVSENSESGAGISICDWMDNYDAGHLNYEPVFVDPTDKTVTCNGNIWSFSFIIEYGSDDIESVM